MPRPLYPQGKDPGTHCTESLVGFRVCLDMVSKRKIPSPRQESNPRPSDRPAYTDWAIPALTIIFYIRGKNRAVIFNLYQSTDL